MNKWVRFARNIFTAEAKMTGIANDFGNFLEKKLWQNWKQTD